MKQIVWLVAMSAIYLTLVDYLRQLNKKYNSYYGRYLIMGFISQKPIIKVTLNANFCLHVKKKRVSTHCNVLQYNHQQGERKIN